MFMYKGYGLVIPIADAGGEETFLGAVNQVCGIGATTIEMFDDSMVLGTYESPDNIYSARVNGYDIDTSDGIVICELPPALYGTDEFTRIDGVMRVLGFEGWQDDSELVGDYVVECEQ